MKRTIALGLAFAAVPAAFASTFTFGASAPNTAIPDNAPAGVSLSASSGQAVTGIVKVTILGLRHTWSGDLVARLTGPGGTVDLFNRPGRTTATNFGYSVNFGSNGSANLTGFNYSFTTGGASLWAAAAAAQAADGAGLNGIPAGTYAASSNLNGATVDLSYVETNLGTAVNGSAGTFTLTLIDQAGGDLGAFDGFEIEAVPEPATLAALGLGALAVMRRRRSAK